MAYRQNNPFSRKTSNPIKQVGVPGLGRAVQSYIQSDPRIDPTFQPTSRRQYYGLVDERGGEYKEGGIAGYRGPDTTIQTPTGSQAYGYSTGDFYVNDPYMQEGLMFDPESGYSRRMLPVTYEKRESGKPKRAFIDSRGGVIRDELGNLDPTFRNIRSGGYDLTNRKEREEFEKLRNRMYENQTRQLERANVMYKLGSSPEEYLNYFKDRPDGRNLPNYEDRPYVQRIYERYGAPGSEERAEILAGINQRYGL